MNARSMVGSSTSPNLQIYLNYIILIGLWTIYSHDLVVQNQIILCVL